MSVTQDEAPWSIALNLVKAAVANPLTGWLGARSRWRILMFGKFLGFTISSFLCYGPEFRNLDTFPNWTGYLWSTRYVPGQALNLSSFPKDLQPTAIVFWGVVVLGPVIGSMMAEHMTGEQLFLS